MAASKPRSFRSGRPLELAGKHVKPSASAGPGEDVQPAGRKRPSMLAAAAFGLWAAALIGLAVLTANPVTLNYAQITRAPLIVQGTFERSAADERGLIDLRVERSWPAGHADETLVINVGPRLSVKAGQSYLVPLEPIDNGHFRVVPTPMPSAPAVYPANPQTLAQLSAILRRD